YTDSGKASGNLETKYKICNYALTFTQEKSRKLKASYKWAYFHLGNNVDIDISGPVIYDWAVLTFEGWLAGCHMSFDTAKSKLSQSNFTLRLIYQKVNEKIRISINLVTSLSAKVNNASLIGLGYTQTLQPGVKLTLSALIDSKNFSARGHKIGLRFELEA
ncbi:hypothetical protein FD754_006518, partial [Muntiacus muntjak]